LVYSYPHTIRDEVELLITVNHYSYAHYDGFYATNVVWLNVQPGVPFIADFVQQILHKKVTEKENDA